MPTISDVAVLAVQTLIDELAEVQQHQVDRMAAWKAARQPAALAARKEAMAALAEADRLDLFESAAERLATECVAGKVAHPVRAAAYNALVALVAADLIERPVFRALYEAWEEGTHGGAGTGAVLRGEELLLTLD
ncbi:MAG: hypothetical protein IT341_05475 [Chloroflexi bacterium]|nr:hypothetical protein [Chloroflexota bacterium]